LILDPGSVKGLEFDEVVVVNPDRIMSEVGVQGLYVALTRPTRRLHVLTTTGSLPAGFPANDQETTR
jgi:DNA helicase IV